MKNKILKFLSVIIFFLAPVIIALAQPLPNDPGPNGTLPGTGAPTVNCQTNAPIGDGIWIILLLAVIYGVYLIWQMRKVEKLV